MNQLRSSFSPPEPSPPATFQPSFQQSAMMGGYIPNMVSPQTAFAPFGYGVQLQAAQPPSQMPMGFAPMGGQFYPAGQAYQPQMPMNFQQQMHPVQQPTPPPQQSVGSGGITPEVSPFSKNSNAPNGIL